MPELEIVPSPRRPRSGIRAGFLLHRELGWLKLNLGTHEYNAYWKGKCLPHRWKRFEVGRRSFAIGPLTVLSTGEARDHKPRLRVIKGGKYEA